MRDLSSLTRDGTRAPLQWKHGVSTTELPEKSLSLLSDIMIVYVENLTESIKKLLELISEVSSVARYKINIEKINCISIANNE